MDDALDDGTRPTRLRRLKKVTGFLAIPLAIVVCLGGLIGGMYALPDDLLGDFSGKPYEELPVGTCVTDLPTDLAPQVVECDSEQARYQVAGIETGGVRGLDAIKDICGDVDHDQVYRRRTRANEDVAYCMKSLRP